MYDFVVIGAGVVGGFVARALTSYKCSVCIVEKESNEPIGSISVLRTFDKDKRAEIGYALGEKWWGKGYTTEALIGVIEYLFSNSEYLVICAKHDTENIASGKVMQKSGMKFIKQIKGGGKNNIHPVCDVNYYEIAKKK